MNAPQIDADTDVVQRAMEAGVSAQTWIDILKLTEIMRCSLADLPGKVVLENVGSLPSDDAAVEAVAQRLLSERDTAAQVSTLVGGIAPTSVQIALAARLIRVIEDGHPLAAVGRRDIIRVFPPTNLRREPAFSLSFETDELLDDADVVLVSQLDPSGSYARGSCRIENGRAMMTILVGSGYLDPCLAGDSLPWTPSTTVIFVRPGARG